MSEWSNEHVAKCTDCGASFASLHDYCPACSYPQAGKTEYTSLEELFDDIKSEHSGLATVFEIKTSELHKTDTKQKSKHTVIDGIVFDSDIEGRRYRHLKQLQLDGVISGLTPSIGNEKKIKFKLLDKVVLPANNLRKKITQRAISYTPDFCYFLNDVYVIEDVKGKYGNSKKNRTKGIVGKPIIGADARLRHKLLQASMPDAVFIIVIDANSNAGKDYRS